MFRPLVMLAAVLVCTGASPASQAGPATGKALPRFESLAVAEAFGRNGPGDDHPVAWVYRRKGLPVQVLEEAREWRKVLDPANDMVWMHASRLTRQRTVMVTDPPPGGAVLFEAPRTGARVLAVAQVGLVGPLTGCIGPWREVVLNGVKGWVDVNALWGAPTCEGLQPDG